jgi:DNA-binding response OmpR family regulator
MSPRLALLDKDPAFTLPLARRAELTGWSCRALASPVPPDALAAMRLDAMVVEPGALGPEAWGYLVRVYGRLPGLGVIVCTGPSSAAQRVRGLRLGADDWVTKPCHPDELLARVQAVIRRHTRAPGHDIEFGEVLLSAGLNQAFARGASAELTRLEYELLRLLAEAQGLVLPREEIYRRVWGYELAHGDRSVDVFVRKLRAKLEKVSPGRRYIHTHFGVGYRLAAEPAAAPVAS